jgi:hypothetical protein
LRDQEAPPPKKHILVIELDDTGDDEDYDEPTLTGRNKGILMEVGRGRTI